MSSKNKEVLYLLAFAVMIFMLFWNIKAYELDKINDFKFILFSLFDLTLMGLLVRKIEKGSGEKK
jgi:hypothetical protein